MEKGDRLLRSGLTRPYRQGHLSCLLGAVPLEWVSGSHNQNLAGGRGRIIATIAAHADWIGSLVLWNRRVISGSEDTRIIVHSIASRQLEATLEAHTDAVNALAV